MSVDRSMTGDTGRQTSLPPEKEVVAESPKEPAGVDSLLAVWDLLLHPGFLPPASAVFIAVVVPFLPVVFPGEGQFLLYSFTWKWAVCILWLVTVAIALGGLWSDGRLRFGAIGYIGWLDRFHKTVLFGAVLGLVYMTVTAFFPDKFSPIVTGLSLAFVAAVFPVSARKCKLMGAWPRSGAFRRQRYGVFMCCACLPLLLLFGYYWLFLDLRYLAPSKKLENELKGLETSLRPPSNARVHPLPNQQNPCVVQATADGCYEFLQNIAELASKADPDYFRLKLNGKPPAGVPAYFKHVADWMKGRLSLADFLACTGQPKEPSGKQEIEKILSFIASLRNVVRVFDLSGESLSLLRNLLKEPNFSPDVPFTLAQAWLIAAVTDGRLQVARPSPKFVIESLTGEIIDGQGEWLSLKDERAYETQGQDSATRQLSPACQQPVSSRGATWYRCPLPVIEGGELKSIGYLWRFEDEQQGVRRVTYTVSFASQDHRDAFIDVLKARSDWKLQETDYKKWEIREARSTISVKAEPFRFRACSAEDHYAVTFSLRR